MNKVNEFQIVSLRMEGFKSFAEPVELTFGNPTAITGGNGRGKSSIADAIAFLITGVPFFGEHQIDRLHSEDNPKLTVSMCYVDENGASHELRRSRSGSRMFLSVDGIDVRQTDLNEMFGERDVFLSIFNPLYFIEELGEVGKNLLMRHLPQIPNEEILAGLSPNVQSVLDGVPLVSPEGMVKACRQEIRDLEGNILYLQGQHDLSEAQHLNSSKTLDSLRKQLSELKAEQKALGEKQFAGMDIPQMQERLANLSARYTDLAGDDQSISAAYDESIHALQIKLAARSAEVYVPKFADKIAEAAERIKTLTDAYASEKAAMHGIAQQRRCPTCHREVLESDVPAMKKIFEDSIGAIVKDGTEQRTQLKELKELERKSAETFEQFKADDIGKLEAEIASLTAERANMVSQAKGRTELEQMRAEMQSITADLELGRLSQAEYDRLCACKEEITHCEAELSALQKATETPIENYAERISLANQEISARKEKVEALKAFIGKRTELMLAQLQMNRVSISLFDVVKSTGEVKDAFKFTYNGRRYDRLSLSEKVRAGMEVSELMKRLTGRNYPVFVDNMESVDDIANVRPTGQVIMAKCVSKAELSVRPVRPIQTAQAAKAA